VPGEARMDENKQARQAKESRRHKRPRRHHDVRECGNGAHEQMLMSPWDGCFEVAHSDQRRCIFPFFFPIRFTNGGEGKQEERKKT
jgi:hypothetical protein